MLKLWYVILCSLGLAFCVKADPAPAVALFYGAKPPLDELKAFDVVVVDPDHPDLNPLTYRRADSELFAYVSVGEVSGVDRSYYHQIPANWLVGKNKSWGSQLIDQSSPEWPIFFADHVIAPLWAKGYRGFFFDTMDSYQLMAKTAGERARQEAGIKAAIIEVKRRWPDARLILNRGFEVLPDIHQYVWMVAAESLFRGWDADHQRYIEVSKDDRSWLQGQLDKVRNDYKLPVLIIDYLPAKERKLARETAQKIQDAGFIPYVTTFDLSILGVGTIEVVPRKVMVIINSKEFLGLHYSEAQRFLAMPLAYLGLVMEYQDINQPLPAYPLTGRYAGIVSWLNNDDVAGADYMAWLSEQVSENVPVAVLGRFGFGTNQAMFNKLGLTYLTDTVSDKLQVVNATPMMGFEVPLRPRPSDIYPLRLSGEGQPQMTMAADNVLYHPAAITSWGGYALYPYTVYLLDGVDNSERWYLNPLSFLTAALRLDKDVPVPDVTTEMGRRLLMVHIDGDGFVSKAERTGYPFAGQVLIDDVLRKYQLPTTLSIIEGEVGSAGLYPDLSPQLEAIAREAFALPWVEVASHTFSHPFDWLEASLNPSGIDPVTKKMELHHLPIKNYVFNIPREITGSANYINQNLLPEGKRTKILLWSGNCVATKEALAETTKTGLLNLNGGDTMITKTLNSWTQIAGLGVQDGDYYQVYAPNQNENVYTNLWRGPFYGYKQVIETFELTETPYRFKPIDIYYHLYAVTKTASLSALNTVYQWALSQPVNPVYLSDYIHKVIDFNTYAVARTSNGFRLRGDGALRTVRLPVGGKNVDWYNSPKLAGIASGPAARYLSLASGSVDLVLSSETENLPYIESANASLTQFERQRQGLNFSLQSYQPVRMTLNQTQGCNLYQHNTVLKPTARNGNRLSYEINNHDALSFRLVCGA
jgi:hypothetical protein